MKTVVSICLLAELIAVLWFQLTGDHLALNMSVIFLTIYFLTRWLEVNRTGQILLSVAVIFCIASLLKDVEPTVFISACARATMFAAFLVAMVFLRVAAKNSDVISQVSYLLINQRPAIRYGMLSYGSTLMGIILSFGTINLVGQMINQGNTLKAAGGNKLIHAIRRKRMSLALHRGFSTIPIASPFSITMALILASIPDLNWTTLVPLSFSLAMLLIGLGWIVDIVSHSRLPVRPPLPLDTGLSWKPVFKFVSLVLILFVFAGGISQILGDRLPLAIMLIAPVFGLVWLYQTQSTNHLFIQKVQKDLPDNLNTLQSEIAIISAASLIGVILSSFLSQDQLSSFVRLTELTGMPLTFVAMCIIPLCALIGVGPLISVTFLATTLGSSPVFEISSYVLALSQLAGWVLALNISPIALSAVMVGGATGCKPKSLTFEWNVSYVLVGALVAFLFIFALESFGVL